MQSTQADKLVMMANQIGKFFASQPRVKVPEAIAEHLRKFWDPRMIRKSRHISKAAEPALIPMRALRCSYWQRRTRPRNSCYGSVSFFRIDI